MSQVPASEHTNTDPSVKAMHLLATIGSLTERGGRITTATSQLKIAGLAVARVRDIVTYNDGSEAVIMDGAGAAAVFIDQPLALVGSRLSNGDRIVESLQRGRGVVEHHDRPITGLFDPTYVPAPGEPFYRFSVRGATTARGGVLREVSGTWNVGVGLGKAAALGDLIHYPDGSTTRIISGLGIADNHGFPPIGFVGSELDNGDIITDSPEWEARASSSTFIVIRRAEVTR